MTDSMTRRLVRHLAACSIENIVEAQRGLTLDRVVSDTVFHCEETREYWRDYFKHWEAARRRFWKDTDRALAVIRAECTWLLKQPADVVARWVQTADIDLTESRQISIKRHAEHIVRHGYAPSP